MERTPVLATLGAVGSAFASALCCVGPVLYVTLGVGAGLASTFEPLRPWFLAGAVLFLGVGFWRVYSPRPRCAGEGEGVDEERRRRRLEKGVLWTGAALVAVFATFPAWSKWLT